MSKNTKLWYVANDTPMSNTLMYGMTAGSKGNLKLREYLDKPLPESYKIEAAQSDIAAITYFERKEGKQMLADGFKFRDLNPIMQAALKHDKKSQH